MQLDAEISDFIQLGIAAAAASCDAQLRPSMARVVGCRVNAARTRITVFFLGRLAPGLLADVNSGGRIAVVFCLPSTERAIQIKGADAHLDAVLPTDPELIIEHAAAFAAQVVPLGYSQEFAAQYLPQDMDDLVAVSFAPTEVYEQTPGPQAGQSMQALA